jgi:uncharacterized protein YqgV (UPF0045/DUF77 family)
LVGDPGLNGPGLSHSFKSNAMEYLVHASVQFVPLGDKTHAYAKIDKAIAVFSGMGLLREVSPLESILEGTFPTIMEALEKAKNVCLSQQGDELVINFRLHAAYAEHVSWEQKVKNR